METFPSQFFLLIIRLTHHMSLNQMDYVPSWIKGSLGYWSIKASLPAFGRIIFPPTFKIFGLSMFYGFEITLLGFPTVVGAHRFFLAVHCSNVKQLIYLPSITSWQFPLNYTVDFYKLTHCMEACWKRFGFFSSCHYLIRQRGGCHWQKEDG